MSEPESTREELILKAVKVVLTHVVKDTATTPGLKHPLQDDTLMGIRDCLGLISQREQELAKEAGREMKLRPHFTDEVRKSEVVISIDTIGNKTTRNSTDPQ